MDHLVRKQARPAFAKFLVNEHTFGRTIIAGLMVFESEVCDLLAEGEQEIVFAEMTGAEERFLFVNEFRKSGDVVRLHLERGSGIGDDVEAVRRARTGRKIKGAEVSASSEGRVD